MAQTYETTKRVQFGDTDLAGFVHFPNYLKYMEEVEYEFLRSVGLDVILYDERGSLGFPRVESHCQYLSPARYGQIIDIQMTVVSNNGKRIEYEHELRVGDRPVAKGKICVACCRFPIDKDPYPIPVPDNILEQIPLTDA